MALCLSLPFIPPIARTPSPVGFVTNENSARDFGKDVTVIKVRNLNLPTHRPFQFNLLVWALWFTVVPLSNYAIIVFTKNIANWGEEENSLTRVF